MKSSVLLLVVEAKMLVHESRNCDTISRRTKRTEHFCWLMHSTNLLSVIKKCYLQRSTSMKMLAFSTYSTVCMRALIPSLTVLLWCTQDWKQGPAFHTVLYSVNAGIIIA